MVQRSEASGWSRGSARIATEEGERANRWGRPGSEGRRCARGPEHAGLGCGCWLVGSGAQWGRATRSRASGLSGVLLGRGGVSERCGELGRCGTSGTRVERPRREEAREQAGLGRVLGREGELGPGKRFGLGFLGPGFGYWWADRVWVPFLFLHLFPISISNSTSSQMNSNLNLNSL